MPVSYTHLLVSLDFLGSTDDCPVTTAVLGAHLFESEIIESLAQFRTCLLYTYGVNIQFIPGSDLANIFVGMEFEQVASRAVQKAALKLSICNYEG